MAEQIRSDIVSAAQWLAEHRLEWPRPIIPFVRDRFSFTPLEAIEALKQAHVLIYAVGRGDQSHER